jgi:Domain of unknown function (DUF4209)
MLPLSLRYSYTALCFWLTVLECRLYDLNNYYAALHAEPAPRQRMILRDLLASPHLCAALPAELLAALRALLSVRGVNLRNLLWHGFLAPCELLRNREWALPVVSITLSLSANSHLNNSSSSSSSSSNSSSSSSSINTSVRAYSLRAYDQRLHSNALSSAAAAVVRTQPLALSTLLGESLFLPPGREQLVQVAIDHLAHGRLLLFSIAALPLLEHGLRCVFAAVNTSPCHVFAQPDKYYSTLDGEQVHSITVLHSVACTHTTVLATVNPELPLVKT